MPRVWRATPTVLPTITLHLRNKKVNTAILYLNHHVLGFGSFRFLDKLTGRFLTTIPIGFLVLRHACGRWAFPVLGHCFPVVVLFGTPKSRQEG